MAQEKIRKGFFFYFGLFVLGLIAVFMVCLVVMIFNPGKTILWMKYFTYNNTYEITKTSDNQDINYGEVFANDYTISIECSYADVVVKCNKDPNLKREGIYIVNHAKGFSGAQNDVNFSYRVEKIGSNRLQIILSEPQGFLHFSKDIQVIVHSVATNPRTFEHLALEVEGTADCDVRIGVDSSGAEIVKPKDVDVKTGTGNIYLENKFDVSNSTLSLEATRGMIRASRDAGGSHKGILTNKDIKLVTSRGNINIDKISTTANLAIECVSGNVNVNVLDATETSVACKDGNYVFGEVNGKLTFERSTSTIITPNIVVGIMNGEFDLAIDGTDILANPNISIKETRGFVNIVAEQGKIVIENAKDGCEIKSDKGFSSYITCADDFNKNLKITNSRGGDIRVTFKKAVGGNIATLQNNSGKTTIEFTSDASFTSTAKNMNNELLGEEDKKIILNAPIPGSAHKNPLTPNSGASGATISIKTDGKIYYNLIAKD